MQPEKKDSQRYLVSEAAAIYELSLQDAWNAIPSNTRFRAFGNRTVTVLSPGVWNFDKGPDFLHAAIQIDGVTVKGAVEIHNLTGDWFKHEHHLDPAYDEVILHVAAENDLASPKLDQLPPLLLIPRPDQDIARSELVAVKNGRCATYFAMLNDNQLKTMFIAAGMERFHAKSNIILRNMIMNGCEEAAMRMIFEYAGGSRNRTCFRELFSRWMEYPPEMRRDETEALLWGESGLLPDLAVAIMPNETRKFARNIWNRWWLLRQSGRPPIQWRRGSSRPQNSPERRIAALVMILAKIGEKPLANIAITANKSNSLKEFVKSLETLLLSHHPLWDNFTNFTCERSRASAVLGRDAVLEIMVNVLLPALHAAAQISPNDLFKELGTYAKNAWQAIPKTQDNRIINNAAAKWFRSRAEFNKTANTAAARQGVIHLYRQYCEKCCFNCPACLIYNSI
jgi:Protein of unknown function (DUF2851)